VTLEHVAGSQIWSSTEIKMSSSMFTVCSSCHRFGTTPAAGRGDAAW